MKRFAIVSFWAVFILAIFAGTAPAAWIIHQAVIDKGPDVWGTGMISYRVKLCVVADGSDVASFALSTYMDPFDLKQIQGGMIRKIVTVPGSAAPTTFTLALSDELGASLPITVTTTSTTAAEDFYPTDEVIFWDLNIDFPDIGDANDAVCIYFYILK